VLGRDGIERQVKAACNSSVADGAAVEQLEVQHIRRLAQDTGQEQKPKRRRKATMIA
jgi:hypothetical protein